jgi:FkbM family methyltransferase
MELAEKVFIICNLAFESKPGVYVEAGANDGLRYSNTVRLERELHWTGLLIEPSPRAFSELVIKRPDNINLNYALVGDRQENSLRGTFTSGSLLSSADKDLKFRDIAVLRHKIRGIARLRKIIGLRPKILESNVPASTIDALLDQSGIPHVNLFSLDVEGYEIEALKGLSKYQPDILVIETRDKNFTKMSHLLIKKGYLLVGDITSDPVVLTEESKTPEHRDLIWVHGKQSSLISKVYFSISNL